jgi:UDP-glucose 4-epimerase
VAIFMNRMRAGERPRIFGDGRQTRDYVYVGDVVDATLAAAGHSGVYNVGTGRETSVLELLDACVDVSGVELEPEFAPARPGELQRSVLDPSWAERELGFRARTSLADGLRATWESMREGERAARAN